MSQPGRHHPVEHVVPPDLGLDRVDPGIPRARRRDDAGKEGRLGEGEVGGVDVEVLARRRLNPVGAATEVDGVHVVLEDAVLVLLLIDLEREQGLLRLAEQVRRRLADVVALHVLLGDARPALAVAEDHGLEQRARGAQEVDPGVRVERAVLRGDDRLRDVLGKVVDRHRLAVREPDAPHRRGAVGVVEGRGLVPARSRSGWGSGSARSRSTCPPPRSWPSTRPIVRPHAPIRRRMRTQRGRVLRADDFRTTPVVRVADARVADAPVRDVGLARRLDVSVGRGRRVPLPVTGTRCECDPVARRSGGFRESVTPGV